MLLLSLLFHANKNQYTVPVPYPPQIDRTVLRHGDYGSRSFSIVALIDCSHRDDETLR